MPGVGPNVDKVRNINPCEPLNMSFLIAFESSQASPQSCCLNDVAPRNILLISVTLDTFHADISPSNDAAPRNIPLISVILDTSHIEMLPLKDVPLSNI